jgi:hypothetical protein
MKYLAVKDYENLLTGSLYYGTGGGGSPKLARNIYRSLKKPVKLKKITDFTANAIFITTYTVGGLNQRSINRKIISQSLTIFQQLIRQKIAGIIPVEIGPLSLALAANLASNLDLPLIDADIVGGRSTPEVFLETITLFNIPRTPLLVINNQGKYQILKQSKNYLQEEKFLRQFAVKSGGSALVLGYPLTQTAAKKSLCQKTVSLAIKTGAKIMQGKLVGQLLFQGKITAIKDIKQGGFTSKIVAIKNNQNRGKLYLKNENLIFWINDCPVLTCPDLIILLDLNNQPIYNLDLRKNLPVKVVGLPAQPLWRTKKGQKLFNPKLFGYNINQKLL